MAISLAESHDCCVSVAAAPLLCSVVVVFLCILFCVFSISGFRLVGLTFEGDNLLVSLMMVVVCS